MAGFPRDGPLRLLPAGSVVNPQYVNGTLYLGGGGGLTSDPDWYALNATTGDVEWQYQVGPETTNYYNWASALTYHGSLYIGVASLLDNPLVPGQLRELNLTGNHAVSHAFDTVPPGEDGGSIWIPRPVDPTTNTVWVTTGNEATGYPPFVNAIIGLNATTLNLSGSWQVPNVSGEDSDFGSTPTLLMMPSGIPLVVASNKDGESYALNRSNIKTTGPWAPIWSLPHGRRILLRARTTATRSTWKVRRCMPSDPDNGNVAWSTTLPVGRYRRGSHVRERPRFAGAGLDVYAVDRRERDDPMERFVARLRVDAQRTGRCGRPSLCGEWRSRRPRRPYRRSVFRSSRMPLRAPSTEPPRSWSTSPRPPKEG